MFWHGMPPEINTARLMMGAGAAPMLQAAAGWEALGDFPRDSGRRIGRESGCPDIGMEWFG